MEKKKQKKTKPKNRVNCAKKSLRVGSPISRLPRY